MKKSPNNRGGAPLFMIIFLLISTGLVERAHARDIKLPPQATVSGTVSDVDGLPLPGVHIQVESTKVGTISDLDGTFSIQAGAEDVLVFSIMGFKRLEVPIAGKLQLEVQMVQEVTKLGEVVLNAGYYTVKEKERTGSIVSVSAKELEVQPVTNPVSALQGRMAGVQVTQTTGVPGGEFDIRIRGQNSIAAGNEPLYVVDGVPFSSESLGSFVASSSLLIDGISPMNNLNFNDIEKIEILKDADATAIYGSRGANGVVLITTKSGTSGKTRVKLQLRQGLGKVASKMDLLNTKQYLAMRREAFENDGVVDYPLNAYDINGTWEQDRYTDWQRELIGGTAYTTMVQGSVSGGSAQTQFMISGNYYRTGSVFPDDGHMEKGGGHSSFKHTSHDKRFNLSLSTDYTVNQNNFVSRDFTSLSLILTPNAPALFNDDGNLNWENGTWDNPLAETQGTYKAYHTNFVVNTSLSYQLGKSFTFKTNLGYTATQLEETKVTPHTVFNPAYGLDSSNSNLFLNQGSRQSWIFEPQISWSHSFNTSRLNLLLGSTFQRSMSKQLGQSGNGFSSNKLIYNIDAANNISIWNYLKIEYKYQAFFGRINYSFKDKYFLNLTGRRDGSSRFGPENRFANFGAIGAAWLFGNEPLIEDGFPMLSFGKLRGSYGITGNDQIGDYQYLDSFEIDDSSYDGVGGLEPTKLFNPHFGWEKNTKLTLGLDLGFLEDRLIFNMEYYRNRSSNQLVGIPMPFTTGYSSLQGNLGALVENSGWEFVLHSLNIVGSTKSFQWNTDFNISFNRNKLIEFPNLEASTYANSLVIGQPLEIRKAYHFTGIDEQTGIYSFEDYNEDGSIGGAGDRQYLIDLSPSFFGGMTNHWSWKGLSLACTLTFARQKAANILTGFLYPGSMFNQSVDVLDHWPQGGPDALVQRYTTGIDAAPFIAANRYSISNRAYSDASYIRMKNIELGFQFPDNILEGVETRLFVQGQNLWTLTSYKGLDPETGLNNLPPLKEWLIGILLTF